MRTALRLLALAASLQTSAAFGDSPAPPTPRITASADGRFAFHQIPGEDDWHGDKSRGVAYAITADGTLRELWRTEGWYSFQPFLADDGHHLVRMGPWNMGDGPAPDHLAVAFYRDGRLLKRYSTAELVRDRSRVRRSVSHYEWLAGYPAQPRLGWDDDFTLTTIDGVHYRFDVTTGEIKSAETDAERAAGWATIHDVDRVLLAVHFVNRPFPYAELTTHLGLPAKRNHLSSGYGRNTIHETFGLTSSRDPFIGYALAVTITPSGDEVSIGADPDGDVTNVELLYYTPDGRRLPVAPNAATRELIKRIKAGNTDHPRTPAALARQALQRMNGRLIFTQ